MYRKMKNRLYIYFNMSMESRKFLHNIMVWGKHVLVVKVNNVYYLFEMYLGENANSSRWINYNCFCRINLQVEAESPF